MMKIALIGAGVIGRVHARNIAANATCSLAHVVDFDRGRADELARSFGGRADNTPDRALADEAVEAVIIASSTNAHKDHVLAAARAGKAVLCEKPIADSLDDARHCVDEIERAGVIAAMGFNRRLDAVHQDLYKQLAAGDIGKVEMLRLVSRTAAPPPPETAAHSGGMIREKGAHFFDLACWLADSDPVEATAMGDCLIDPRFADFSDVDTAILTVRLQSGALAGFDFGRRTAYGVDELIEVFGSEGLLLADRQPVPGPIKRAGAHVSAPGLNGDWYERFAPTYVDELAAFAAAVRGEADVHAAMTDGLRAQAISEAAIVALRERRMVTIEPAWR
jgi:myo-inositol 2-dehydrogenase/D-chiro-inositol 1-dehydrogenase